ncbi:hypothetical protein ASG60_19310 [Methylobacterium sp. Leaf469]|nr:hypothetical protein ASF27_18475 [Methylobacterium sp. Leaf102]KQU00923.1 hypothetical protein ASG60_19310 [Methylobacterium sp. Leaf469]
MATVREDTRMQIRCRAISAELKQLLSRAADVAGVALVRVTSGGQAPKGSGGKRTGSTRHDHGRAADLQLLVDGSRALDFTDPDDLPIVEAFVTAAAALGANGIGAGVDYMGKTTLHIGFGTSPRDRSELVWGAGGHVANAPIWLQNAAQKGWANPVASGRRLADALPLAGTVGRFMVAARDGLRLRAGPGLTFDRLRTIGPGSELTVQSFDGPNGDWARVDLNHDGLIDGHLHAAFLVPVAPPGDGRFDDGLDSDEGVEEPEATYA